MFSWNIACFLFRVFLYSISSNMYFSSLDLRIDSSTWYHKWALDASSVTLANSKRHSRALSTTEKRAELQLQNHLDGVNDLVLDSLGSSDNTLVGSQGPALAEVQTVAVDVGHLATGLTDDNVTGSMIPDLLLVVLLDGETEVDVTRATSNRAVLGLRVQSHARASDSQALGDGGVVVLGGVASLDTLAEDGLGNVGDGAHRDGLARGKSAVGQGPAGGTFAMDGGEEDTVGRGIGLLGASAGVDGGGIVNRQVRGTNGTDLDVAVDNQTKADGVLAAAQETLGAVNGVESPDTALAAAGTLTLVDDLQHALLTGEGTAQNAVALRILQLDVLHEAPDLGAEGLVLTQLLGLFLGNNLVIGEVLANGLDDEGLGAEVANGNGGLVVLGKGALGLFEKDLLGEDGGPLNGEFGDVAFLLVRHDCGVEVVGGGGGRGRGVGEGRD